MKRAAMGPSLTAAVALSSLSPSFSRDSQPGMQDLRVSGSFRASHTFCRGAAMRRSPDISILKNLLAYEALSTGLGGWGQPCGRDDGRPRAVFFWKCKGARCRRRIRRGGSCRGTGRCLRSIMGWRRGWCFGREFQ